MDGISDEQRRSDEPQNQVAAPTTGAATFIGPSLVDLEILIGAFEAGPYGFGVLQKIVEPSGDMDFIWLHANSTLKRLLGGEKIIGRRTTKDAADGGTGGRLSDLAELACCGAAAHEWAMPLSGGRRRVRAQCFRRAGVDYATVTISDFIADFAAASNAADPMREALEHSGDAVALFDADGRLVDATGRLKDLFPEIADILKPGAPISELLAQYYARGDRAAAEPTGWRARRMGGHSIDGGETTFRSISGRWLRNSEWSTADGGVISIYTDVTAFKEQEERLRDSEAAALTAQREAEKASRAKSEFLTHMSHEFRTPLNAIIGFAELMELETLGPVGDRRYLDYARDILDGGRRLLALVDDALNLSRIDAGRIHLVEELVDLTGEIAIVAAKADEEARKRKVILTVDVAENLPPLVGDRRAIHQMIDHLLSNALKFTPPTGAVLISASQTPDGGLGVMIADTGSGIAPEDLEKAVTPFGRTEMAASPREDGAGLGLPVVKRLIELHGGRLDLDSAPDVGTTAILTFPTERVMHPNALPSTDRVVG